MPRLLITVITAAVLSASLASAAEPSRPLSPAEHGYQLLTEKAYLPPDFDEETLANVWKQWPEKLRYLAEQVSPEQRLKMAYTRYGLTPRPGDPSKPLQYVVDKQGYWTMNCFACHGGTVPDGQGGTRVWPGAPNTRYALQTLTEETRLTKLDLQKPLSRMDLGSVLVPLGATNGTTNAVMFGVVLMGYRDANLAVRRDRPIPAMTHHDMDAPPWWHFKRKKMLYIDGFAAKGHRGLMQFMLVPQNGPETFRAWDREFKDVYAYIESIQPPPNPYPLDRVLAERGRRAFNSHCAECHGTYGNGGGYPERLVPIAEVGTDRVRLDALTPAHRAAYGESWFTSFGKLPNVNDPGGYVAPPLDGIWASAPYLHNGSVPTLWHLLHPNERPKVWKRQPAGYDSERVGPAIETFEELPLDAVSGWQRREYFDTRAFGKSAQGHDFPQRLSEDEKRAVLEYLKSL